MNQIKQHIIFKIATLLLVATFLVPTVVKFHHIFSHHDHEYEVCLGEKSTHLHEIDLDCEFYKFQLNKNFVYTSFNADLFQIPLYHKTSSLTYNYLYNHRRLSLTLRGPPVLV
ncbi:hypothetical protein GCM10022397_09570 [Flavivirga jejuensis]